MDKPIYNIDDIPTPDKDPEFWAFITNTNFKQILSFLILNEIRKYQPEQITTETCRTQLSKIKAYQELLDFPNALIADGEKEEETDSIPD